MPAEKQPVRVSFPAGLRYLLAAFLLASVFYVVPFESAWRVLRSLDAFYFAAALLLLTGSRWCGTVRTHILARLHGARISVARLFDISCVSTMYGLALPGSVSGGIVRWHRIGQSLQNHGAVAALVIFERLIDYSVLASMGLIGWFLDVRTRALPGLGWLLALAIAVFLVPAALSLTGVSAQAADWVAARNLRTGGFADRIRRIFIRSLEAMSRHRDVSVVLMTVVTSVGAHILATGGLYFMGHALGLDVDYTTMLWLRACTTFITAAPMTPAGLGVNEVSTLLLLGMVGVSAASAVALSLQQFLAMLFFAAIGGLLEARRYLLGGRLHSTGGETPQSDRGAGIVPVNAMPAESGPQPAVALIVLSYQRKALLLTCLESATASRYRPCHIVVVDNGSTDGSADAVELSFPGVTVLRSKENRGVAGGRNFGAHWVFDNLDAAFLVFIDDDTLIEPDTVGEMVDAIRGHREIGLISPKAYRRRGDQQLLSAGGLQFNPYTGTLNDVASGELDRGQYESIRDIQACPGFAFLVRREVFDSIGLFDEHFNPYGWEDADFSLRAGEAGYRLVYAHRAIVYHLGGRVGRGPIEKYEYHKARSMFYFVRRHTNRVQWVCFLLVLPCRSLARIGSELLRGRFNVVRMWLSSLRSNTGTGDSGR